MADVNEQNLLTKLEAKIKKQASQLEKEIKSIDQKILAIQKQKTKLIQLLANEVITQKVYRNVVQENEEELKQLLHSKNGDRWEIVKYHQPRTN
jgi:predicted  nucleic acid-binding Zn-ribbon protein